MYERHKGDDLLSTDKKLKYKWEWCRVATHVSEKEIKKWTHFQVSKCHIGDWMLEAIQWCKDVGENTVYYEASISYRDDRICSSRARGNWDDVFYNTRIKAQIAAEKLLKGWITDEYEKIVLMAKPIKD